MKKTNTKLTMISSSLIASCLFASSLQARTNDFTEFSQVQKTPAETADVRGVASFASSKSEVSSLETTADATAVGVEALTGLNAVPGLSFGVSFLQTNVNAELKSKDDTNTGKIETEGEGFDAEASLSYQMPMGENKLRLGYGIIQSNSETEGSISTPEVEGVSLNASIGTTEQEFLQHRLSAAFDVQNFTVGIDYTTSADDSVDGGITSYKPSDIDLYGRVALTESVALGAMITQHNFDNLEDADKDLYRNYQSLQLAAIYNQDKLTAQARLATSGAAQESYEDYSFWKTDAYVGYKIMPKLELGGSVNYTNESFKIKDSANSDTDTSGLGFGIEATYSI